MSEEPKPTNTPTARCPWCKVADVAIESMQCADRVVTGVDEDNGPVYWAECQRCGAQGPIVGWAADAIPKWNECATPAPAPVTVSDDAVQAAFKVWARLSGEPDDQDIDDVRQMIAAYESARWAVDGKELQEAKDEAERLRKLINTPETKDFVQAVQLEAAHQRERWGANHDAGKKPADWFWLVGYLAGKALHAAKADALSRYRHVKRGTTYEVLHIAENENDRGQDLVIYRGEDDGKVWSRPAAQFYDGRFEPLPPRPPEKLLHHIITTAAALANWHHQLTAGNDMRPGIAEPTPPPTDKAREEMK